MLEWDVDPVGVDDEPSNDGLREGERFFMEQIARRKENPRELFLWQGTTYVGLDEGSLCPFLIDRFLPRGYVAVLGGNSKMGKSSFATALALAVANGEPFLGLETVQSPVLWLAYEETRRERALVMRDFPKVPSTFYVNHDCPKIDDWRDVRAIRKALQETKSKLLVIDPLFGATTCSLNDGRAARDAMMRMKSLAYEEDVAILLIHHINKDANAGHVRERFAESNQILATASMDLLMDSRMGADGVRQIRLQGRGRGEFTNRTWLIRSTGVAHYELIGDGESETGKSRIRSDAILEALTTSEVPLTSEELAAVTKQPVQQTRNLISQMIRDGEIEITDKLGKWNRYGLPSNPLAHK